MLCSQTNDSIAVNESGDRTIQLGDFIRDRRNQAKLSLRKLSELAGISNTYLSQIERGLRKPSADILQSIAKGLRISAETLYVQAGILKRPDDRDHSVVAAILTDLSLDDRQRQVLIDVYESLRSSDGGVPVEAEALAEGDV